MFLPYSLYSLNERRGQPLSGLAVFSWTHHASHPVPAQQGIRSRFACPLGMIPGGVILASEWEAWRAAALEAGAIIRLK